MSFLDQLAKILDKLGIDEKTAAFMGAAKIRTELEKYYDKLEDTNLMASARGLPANSQFAIEWIMYILGAVADKKLDEKSGWHKLLKDVSVDIPSEVAKRIKNEANGKMKKTIDNQEFLHLMLELDKEKILDIVNWLSKLPEKKRLSVIRKLTGTTKEKLEKIITLDEDDRNLAMEIVETKKKGSDLSKKVGSNLRALARNIKGVSQKGGKNNE